MIKKGLLKLKINLLVLMFTTLAAYGQNGTHSPYSRFGIGDLTETGFTYQTAMGGAGSATASSYYINILNPASLVHDTSTIFEFGMRGEYASYATKVQTATASTANFSHFSLAFPIIKTKWSAAIGLSPVSSIGYDLNLYENIQDVGKVKNIYSGEGGLTKFYIGNGFKVAKNLSAGITAGYLFGTLQNTEAVEFTGADYFNTKYIDETTIADFYFQYGLLYTTKLKNSKTLAFGISGSPDTKVTARKYESYYNYINIASFEVIKDSLIGASTQKGHLLMPWNTRLGITLSDYGKWSASVDFLYQAWEQYESFGRKDSLTNSYGVMAGGEYRKNKLVWRVGGHYKQNYLELRNKPVNEFGVSVGMAFVKLFPKRPASTLNFALEYVNRGASGGELLEENYFRFHIGLTLADVWFIRAKYE